ncbi:MAG: hypothetical protein ABSE42_04650 [Bryobacteraceae bacterium]
MSGGEPARSDATELDYPGPGYAVMRTERPQPLTRDEHLELGRELKQARTKLNELATLVVEVYGPQNHAAFTFQKIIEALDTLSEDMQAQAAEDLRGEPVEGLYT